MTKLDTAEENMLPLIFLNYVVALLVNLGVKRIPFLKNNDTWPCVLAGTFLINMWFIQVDGSSKAKRRCKP